MTQTYSQLQKKIEKLQKEADVLRQKELGGVVARIKVAIEHYGLTADQLGLASAPVRGAASSKSKSLGKAAAGAKYSNGNGQVWSGRGPRPRWLRDAIAGGASLESFLAAPGAAAKLIPKPAAPAKGKPAKAAKTSKRKPSTVLYQDGAGNSWTGRGPRPRWIKELLARGKTLEELLG
ncbi:H-NS family nucleoid-associated regulatory protein [Variovorax sp. M-6]|uniref:H-NS family nucleoid-associated regulatory protein n=1 Tax=Variovorax sp. M-6 TaxID=3233041 RepID=UPI003F9A58B9